MDSPGGARVRVIDALGFIEKRLRAAGVAEPRLESEVLLASALGRPRVYVLAWGERELAPEQFENIKRLAAERCRRVPLQHLTGKQEFMSLEFKITPHTFIPRADTEVLVETALAWARRNKVSGVVEVGTGSGAVIISLAYYLKTGKKTAFFATEKDARALETARANAADIGVDVNFLEADLLQPFLGGGEYYGVKPDMVVSNPPYISAEEFSALPPELLFEPRAALYGGADGLEVYRRLLPQCREVLRPGGIAVLEIGWQQASAVQELAFKSGFPETEVFRDWGGRDRVVAARRP